MSEERFDRIEQGLDRLETGQEELKAGQAVMQSELAALQSGQNGLTIGLDDLHHQMLILHEKVMDQIKAIPDPAPQLERMMDTKIEGLREEIGRQLDPLEAVVRRHFGT